MEHHLKTFPNIDFVNQKIRNVSISHFDNLHGSEYVSGFTYPQNLVIPLIRMKNLDLNFGTLSRDLPTSKIAIGTS